MDPESYIYRMRNDGKVWTWRDHMLWFQVKMLDRLTVVIGKGFGMKSVKSLELPDYPWEESKAAARKYGNRGDTPSEDVIGYIDSLYE